MTAGGETKAWRAAWHRFRGLFSAGILVVAGLALAGAGYSYFTNSELPDWVANGRLVTGLLGRYGFQYHVDSLRVGRGGTIDATGVDGSFGESPARIDIHLDRVSWSDGRVTTAGVAGGAPDSNRSLVISAVRAEAGLIEADDIRFVGDSGAAVLSAASIRLPTAPDEIVVEDLRSAAGAGGTRVSVRRLTTTHPRVDDQTGALEVDQISATGLELGASLDEASPSFCEALPAIVSPLDGIRNRAIETRAEIESLIARLGEDTRRAVAWSIGIFFVLQLLAAGSIRNRTLRITVAAAGPACPLVVATLPAEGSAFFWISLAAGTAIAAASWWVWYRRAAHWYQKWEPVAVGVIGPLAVSAAMLGADRAGSLGVELPSEVGVRTIAIGSEEPSRFDAMACGRGNDITLGRFRARLDDLELPVTAFLDGRAALRLSSFELEGPNDGEGVSIEVSNPDAGSLLAVSDLAWRVDDIVADVNLDESAVERIDADIRLSGDIGSVAVREGLEQIPVLRDQAEGISNSRIAFAAAIRGPASDPAPLDVVPDPDSEGAGLRVRASLALDLDSCAFPMDAAVAVDLPGLAASANLEWRGRTLRLTRGRTSEDSIVGLGDAEANVSIGDRIEVDALLHDVAVAIGVAEIFSPLSTFSAAVPAGCAPTGRQTTRASFEGIELRIGDEYRIGAEDATFTLDRDAGDSNRFDAEGGLSGVTLIGSAGGQEPWLSADVPVVRASVSGRTSPEFLPREIEGDFDFALAGTALGSEDPEPVILGLDRPVRFTARVRDSGNVPELIVPDQHRVLRQSVHDGLPEEVPLDFSFGISPGANPEARATVRSDWIALPRAPTPGRNFQLDRVSNLALSTSGRVETLPFEGLLWSGDFPLCRQSLVADFNPFRIEAVLEGEGGPTIRLLGEAGGTGTDLSEILVRLPPTGLVVTVGDAGLGFRANGFEREILGLSAPGGRIRSLDTRVTIDDTRPLGGAGPPLALVTRIRTDQTRTNVSSRLAADGITLLEAEANRTRDRWTLATLDTIPLRRLWDGLLGFLDPLDCTLQWIDPDLRVDAAQATIDFSDDRVAGIDALLQLAPGSSLTLDLDRAESLSETFRAGRLRRIRSTIGPTVPLRVDAHLEAPGDGGDASDGWAVGIDTAVPIQIEASNADGTVASARVDVETGLEGSLHTGQPDRGAVLNRAADLFADARVHWENAVRIFRGPDPEPATIDAEWDLGLDGTDSAKARPFEFVGPDRELRGRIGNFRGDASVRFAGQSVPHRLSASGDLEWALRTHEGDLVLELVPALETSVVLESQPDCQLGFAAPLKIAFTDRLAAATGGADRLWDSARYMQFWERYTPAYSTTPSSQAPIECSRLLVGNMSLEHLAFRRLPPLVVGLSDHIQLHAPFDGELFFGTTNGLLQADLAWTPDRLSATLGGRVSLEGFEAGAIQLASGPGYLSAIEDELLASVDFLVPDVLFGPNDPGSPANIPSLDLDLSVRRSSPGSRPPGQVQGSTELDTRLMNEVLDRILRSVQFSAPPSRLTYDDLDLRFVVVDGVVRTDRPLLRLEGVHVLPTGAVDVDADVNVHWRRPGSELAGYRLESLLSSFTGLLAPPVPPSSRRPE